MQLPQPGLGELGHRVHPGQGRRMHGLQRSADVHHTDQPPVPRIRDRGTGAGPGGMAADEVLGGEDLHGAAHHGRGAHAVGADDVLPPVGAQLEAEPVGLAQHRRAALPPQHPPVLVGDDHDVVGDVRDRQQPLAQHRQHMPQRGGLPAPLHLLAGEQPGAEVMVRVDPAAQHPAPGLLDHRARRDGSALSGEGGVAHVLQHPGRARRVDGGQLCHVHR